MDVTWSHVCVTPSVTARLVVLFCIAWPFVTLAILRRGGRSSVPITAMLVPMAVGLSGTWVGLMNVMRGMTLYGIDDSRPTAAGLAEALSLLPVAASSVAGVAILSLVRRHRPVADRGAAMIAACVLADAYIALGFSAGAIARQASIEGAVAGAIVSAAIMLAAVGWLFRTVGLERETASNQEPATS